MRRRWLVALLVVLAAACASAAPPEARTAGGWQRVDLPAPATTGTRSLEDVLASRRSVRSFTAEPLTSALLGQLLWAGQGVTAPDGKRTAPSAGALYPLELYVVEPGRVWHYLPDGHDAEVRAEVDLRPALARAAFGQEVVGAAPAVVVVAADPSRTAAKYGAQAGAFVDREAGHATQNILLEATALGLGAVPVGGFDPARVAQVLALPPGQDVRYLVPVGHPAG